MDPRFGAFAMTKKVLWAIHMPDHAKLLADAIAVGASAVCIRSSNSSLPDAIADFHQKNIAVHAWRWPAVSDQPHSATHYYALKEAEYVVDVLLPKKLDGYIVDPESDGDGGINDWNHLALAPLAHQFCDAIKTGAQRAGLRDFQFGVTSGCTYPSPGGKPNIPWQEFSSASDTFYPQCYWRWTNPKTGLPENINGGTPAAAARLGLAAWRAIAGGRKIVPMAGELDVITVPEIAAYAAVALDVSDELHFFEDGGSISPAKLEMIHSL